MLIRLSFAAIVAIVLGQTSFGQKASATAVIAPAPGTVPAQVAAVDTPPVTLPKVTQIDIVGLKRLIKPLGRPLLINFWATWCPPCIDEFPDLVKIDADYRGKLDVITVSLDDLADIETYVPKFLAEMKAEMPAYLLHTKDESAAIRLIAKDWAGNLPMTVLYETTGKVAYMRNGRIRVQPLRDNIEKLLSSAPSTTK
jgi:thiol-disulfide isomerase/thioredoxin